MNPNPDFMLVITDSPFGLGSNRTRIMYSDIITAIKLIPFNPKHQVAPSVFRAMPPITGPIIRAKLNWIEFRAIAFGRSSGSTSVGTNAEEAGPPKDCAVPVTNDSINIGQTCRKPKYIRIASTNALVIWTY